jgi:ATP-dependent Clp protease ATP-binding subunit ClpC
MFSRFTEKAIQVIMKAQEEAKRLGHDFVGTEHVLLGIIHTSPEDNVCVKSLEDMGVSIDEIEHAIEENIEYNKKSVTSGNIPFTSQVKHVLSMSWDEARQLGHSYVSLEHLFLALIREQDGIASKILASLNVTPQRAREALLGQMGSKLADAKVTRTQVNTPLLNEFGRDLTWLAAEDKLDPVIGRQKEIERLIQTLCRRTKNNPVLVGEAGVGKTAIIEGLAQLVQSKNVPKKLHGKRVISLDLGLLVAGTKYRGEFEERVKKLMEEVRKAKNIILFIDELHTIIGTGSTEGSLDVANMFKPALARGELQCVGATTLDEYRKHIEGDSALERRFQSVMVEPPSLEDTLAILKGLRKRYEDFHGIKITDEALEAAATLSDRYITERQLPDKAVDLIDEAASRAILQGKKTKLKKEDIAEIISSITGVPLNQLTEKESERLLHMDDELRKRVIGQDEAIVALTRAIKRSKAGLKDPKRPIGSFIFLGPTGVGKTELSKALAQFMFGKDDSIIRIDMSEYTEKHTTSRLVGSPPGYVGYDEGGQLTEPVRRKPYSIVLFDEIEKASPEVLNLMLQILEDGRLTDASGRLVNFKNTIIIMTSNAGAKLIEKSAGFGFVAKDDKDKVSYEKMKEKIQEEMKHVFAPEFLGRIDDIIVFQILNKDNMKQIIDIMLKDLNKRLTEKEMTLELTGAAKEWVIAKGYKENQGARPLRRALLQYVEDRLADALLEGKVSEGHSVVGDIKDDAIIFSIKEPTKPASPKKLVKA